MKWYWWILLAIIVGYSAQGCGQRDEYLTSYQRGEHIIHTYYKSDTGTCYAMDKYQTDIMIFEDCDDMEYWFAHIWMERD